MSLRKKLLKFFCLDRLDELEDDLFGIQFKEELSNGSFIFLIITMDNLNWTGAYVVVSPSGDATIINDFFPSDVSTMLKVSAKEFFNASR